MKRCVLYGLLIIWSSVFAQQTDVTEIIILHVNDMHGKIDKFPYLSTMIKEIKQQHDHVFLFSAGDIFSGNPIVDRYPEKGYPMIDLMNMLPFTISTLGNHEFDFGGEVLAKRIGELKHPVVCANIVKKPSYFPWLKPYEILTVKNIKVAVLGITQVSNNGYPDTHPDRVKDFAFEHGEETVKKYLPKINKYDIRLVLSHMGYEQDSILATKYPRITAIIGGHSHKKIQPMKKINGVAIVQAENYVKYLGMMTIKLKGKKIIEITDTLLPVAKNIMPDTEVKQKVDFYNNNEEFNKKAGYATDTIQGIQALGCMMATAYRTIASTDFAIQNSGGIRISTIPQGYITVRQIFELDPFSNDIIVCKLKPAQIRQIIRFGYEKEGQPDIFSSGFTSKIYTDLNGKIRRIDLFDANQNPLDENKTYQIALGSYVFNAYKFDKLDKGTPIGKTTTDAIFEYLAKMRGISFRDCNSAEWIMEKN
ncbi:MAG: bifunctional metallophosphatase/5'-nucleotidase [Bacteroidales bacterium]|nr:bifunctional metallophosphatase/5'-nucleotidase [Bacteroidales bacterium]